MKNETKTKILILVARLLNRIEIWQLRFALLRFKINKTPADFRRWFMAKFFLRVVEVRVRYADATPRAWWVRADRVVFPPIGVHDGHGIVVQCDVEFTT